MVTHLAAAAARSSSSPMELERAHRACEKCTRTKKKCDKALPTCSRCARLATQCCYDFVYTAPGTAVVDSGHMMGSGSADLAGPGKPLQPYSIYDPNFEVSSFAIMSFLSSRNIDWREATERYLRTMNPWLYVVHCDRFTRSTEGLGPRDIPGDPTLALLILCMELVTEFGEAASATLPEGAPMTRLPAYLAAKRILGVLRGLAPLSVELVQCTVLLGLFEFGHGEVKRAYVTIGDANTMINAMCIRPGKYVAEEKDAPVSIEDEERRCLYWAIFVLDRLIHVECNLTHMPLLVAPPAADDLLPTTNLIWNRDTHVPTKKTQRHPANIAPSEPLGPFQRNCQCAMLYTYALSGWDQPRKASVEDFSELDIATRTLVEAMVIQSSGWGDFFECFATCSCLLLLVYCRYLRTVDPTTIHPSTSDVDTLKAIAGLNFTVRIIADTTTDMNDQLARRPHLLAPCSPITPYSAYHCLMVLSRFEHIIPDADDRFHAIFCSLHYFAKRWGVANDLVKRIELLLADEDDQSSIPWCFMRD